MIEMFQPPAEPPTMVDESTAPRKTLVRKHAGLWYWVCPCGFHGSTRFHRLALLLAVAHSHRMAVTKVDG